ncbi:hypothetical protein [Novilysobacter erysipheiresistens]|uniref:Uncharacterized protein n=1 Tax=Novilysobacter erysipheiresistens TaxID=1749332 RepID=A0ABU7YY75_9GAMM
MNIYKGLLFLDGFRVAPEDADDRPTAAAPAPTPATRRSMPTRAAAAPRWRRTLRGVAAFAGVLPADPHPGGCG